MSKLILVHIGYCFALEINDFQTIVIVLLLMKISLIVNFSFDEGCHFLSSFYMLSGYTGIIGCLLNIFRI